MRNVLINVKPVRMICSAKLVSPAISWRFQLRRRKLESVSLAQKKIFVPNVSTQQVSVLRAFMDMSFWILNVFLLRELG